MPNALAERVILDRVLDVLFAKSPTLAVNDGEDETACRTKRAATKAAFATDDCTIILADGEWVTFIWGNGEECIHDHSISLTEVLQPVFDWIEGKE